MKFILGFVLGALIGSGAVQAARTYHDIDDVYDRIEQAEMIINSQIMLWCDN